MNCIINEQGEMLYIIENTREIEPTQSIVPLSNMYEVYNVEGYSDAVWDFKLGKWVGRMQ